MKLHANVCSQWEWTKLRQLLVIVLLGLGIVSTYGQTKTVSGIVKSESGGEPLVGATVKVKETNTGGITDIDGRYTIQANLGQTLIVSYIGYRTKELPAFYTTHSGFQVDYRLDTPREIADAFAVKQELGLAGGMLVTNPIPDEYAMDLDYINKNIDAAIAEANALGIHGKEITPFLLDKIQKLTGGDSLKANIRLVFNNARLGAQIATELAGR